MRMLTVKVETIAYGSEGEHVLRRRGGAVVVQWHNLSKAARELLMEQAVLMDDRDSSVQARQQIESFINTHRHGGK
jgi:hypothetical protein